MSWAQRPHMERQRSLQGPQWPGRGYQILLRPDRNCARLCKETRMVQLILVRGEATRRCPLADSPSGEAVRSVCRSLALECFTTSRGSSGSRARSAAPEALVEGSRQQFRPGFRRPLRWHAGRRSRVAFTFTSKERRTAGVGVAGARSRREPGRDLRLRAFGGQAPRRGSSSFLTLCGPACLGCKAVQWCLTN